MELALSIIIGLMILGAIYAIHARDLLSAVIAGGIVGYGLVISFLLLKAPDLAIVQIVVETITLIIMVAVVLDSSPEEPFSKLDSQGFVTTRILTAFRLECYRVYEEGIASKEDIDKACSLAFGHPMGQFELADFSGLDIEVDVVKGMVETYGDRFRPTQRLLNLVRAGRIGRKSKHGWYDYDD